MNVQQIKDRGQTPNMPTGKVVGVIETEEQFQQLVQKLEADGFDKIQVLRGQDGIDLLERAQGFFFSDLEERVLDRHIEALKNGHLIFLLKVSADQKEQISGIATQYGGKLMVHFGFAAVTWLES